MSRKNRAPVPVLNDQVEATATTDELEPEACPTNPLAPEHATPLPPAVACPLTPVPAAPGPPACCGDPCGPLSHSQVIDLPLAAPGNGYGAKQTHLDLKLRGAPADFVDRLRRGLNDRSVRLADGKHIRSANDAVKWLIEQHIFAQVQSS